MEELYMIHDDSLPELPQPIITQILSYLPEKQQHQCSILSKAFLLSWSERPNLCFQFNDVKQGEKIDATLERYKTKRLAITKFQLAAAMTKYHCITTSTNRWLDFVITNVRLQEIELYIADHSTKVPLCYNLPIGIFSAEKLRRLVIVGSGREYRSVSLNFDVCQFEKQNLSGLRSLTSMVLSHVKIESRLFQKLISNCSKVENLCVSYLDSPGLEKIEVHELEKIKILNIRYCDGLRHIDIKNAPNLKRLKVVYNWKTEVPPRVTFIGAPKLNDIQITSS